MRQAELYGPVPGSPHITDVAAGMVKKASETTRRQVTVFNGVILIVEPGERWQTVASRWRTDLGKLTDS